MYNFYLCIYLFYTIFSVHSLVYAAEFTIFQMKFKFLCNFIAWFWHILRQRSLKLMTIWEQDLKDQLVKALYMRWTRVWLRARVVHADLDQNFLFKSTYGNYKTGKDVRSTLPLDSTQWRQPILQSLSWAQESKST